MPIGSHTPLPPAPRREVLRQQPNVKWINVIESDGGNVPKVSRHLVRMKDSDRDLETLKAELTAKLNPYWGPVRNIYTPAGGTVVTNVKDLEHNKAYAVGGTKFKPIPGFSKEWIDHHNRTTHHGGQQLQPKISTTSTTSTMIRVQQHPQPPQQPPQQKHTQQQQPPQHLHHSQRLHHSQQPHHSQQLYHSQHLHHSQHRSHPSEYYSSTSSSSGESWGDRSMRQQQRGRSWSNNY